MEVNILSTVVQGGSFALLCFVVYWLTSWVPKRVERADVIREAEAKSREVVARESREALERATTEHREAIDKLSLEHKEALSKVTEGFLISHEKMITAFNDQQKYERERCDQKNKELFDHFDKRHIQSQEFMTQLHTSMREVVHAIADVQQSWAMWKAVTREQEKIKTKEIINPQNESGKPV